MLHPLPFINDKLQSLCPLFLCPNYCLYAVTVGVADGVVADTVNILHLHFFFLPICISSWVTCVVDIKTQELITFVFILPVSACHSLSPPPPFFFHCALHSGIVHTFAVVSNWIIMPANPQGHLRIMQKRKGRGWNMGFVVKACISRSLKWNLYNFKGGSSICIEVFMLSWKGLKTYFFLNLFLLLHYYF